MTVPPPTTDPQGFLRQLFDAAVGRAQAAQCLPPHLPSPPRGRTLVLGAGKAAAAMAQAVESHWPAQAPLSGLVVTRHGHVPNGQHAGRIEVVEAAHPVPDAAGQAAARRILDLTKGLTPDDLVLCLLSGGGSALLSLPAEGVDLADKQAITRALLHSGAPISEINQVRKHLSAIKGGRLGAACAPAQVWSLLISDVPGDAPDVIASGPTVPDPSRCADALAVLDRHQIALPPGLRERLSAGALETPKPGDPRFAGHTVRLIATPRMALEAAAALAEAAGVPAHILGDDLEGEAQLLGRGHAELAHAIAQGTGPFTAPCVLLSGGEATVTVEAAGGCGGRAREFLLACALALDGQPGVHVAAADTDGIDGQSDVAGGWIGPGTLARATATGRDAASDLHHHQSHAFFEAVDQQWLTGPTFTNVNDFRAVLVLPP